MFRLVDQMQSAAQSVPGNIAEGFGRRMPRDKARFYTIAKGSADELKDQLIFVRDKGYWRENLEVQSKLEEVCRMLRRLIELTLGEGDAWGVLGFFILYSLFSSDRLSYSL
jgi:four helix bundle protein